MKIFIKAIIVSLGCYTSLQAASLYELMVAGNTLWSQGKLIEAEHRFIEALKINPDSSEVHARLANLYLTQNKTAEAIQEFQNAIISDSENANLFIGIAIAYLHQQYYRMAESMVNHAIQLAPEMKNAQQLKTYIDAKKGSMNNVPEYEDPAATQSIPAHENSQSLHANK